MYNKYTIELLEIDSQVKAVVYLNKNCLGTVWRPTVDSKEDIKGLLESVGLIIYGQEKKAKLETESSSKVFVALEAQSKKQQEKL